MYRVGGIHRKRAEATRWGVGPALGVLLTALHSAGEQTEPAPSGRFQCPSGAEHSIYESGSPPRYITHSCVRTIDNRWRRLDGPMWRYDPNEVLWWTGEFEDGERSGVWTVFLEDGTISHRWKLGAPDLICPPNHTVARDHRWKRFWCMSPFPNPRTNGMRLELSDRLRPRHLSVMIDGRMEGTQVRWKSNGELEWVCQFAESRLLWSWGENECATWARTVDDLRPPE